MTMRKALTWSAASPTAVLTDGLPSTPQPWSGCRNSALVHLNCGFRSIHVSSANTKGTQQMRVLVTGGAGFVGSHLCDALLAEGHQVACVDNLLTGSKRNIAH